MASANTIIVTGGLGFIGSNLVDLLVENKYNVVVFDNEATGHNFVKHERVKTIIGDITKTTDLAKLPSEDILAVVHLAAAISVAESMENPEKYTLNNVVGSRNVLEWCVAHKVKTIVGASSAACYGDPERLPCEETMQVKCISPYAETKYEMEVLFKEYNSKHGMNATALRFFNVYGPRQDPKSQYSGVISKFLDQASTNGPITIFGDGKNTRDFVFVKDVGRAIMLACTKATGFNVFNVGTETKTTIRELADTIVGIAKATSTISLADARAGDIVHSLSSTHEIRTKLGYKPLVDLPTGLGITYQWFLESKST